ncbi:hypothetical protein TNCT_710761 [Trichonephila clavata]|uniref:Uncharacterized protein n=1 Tax=Trichonephila clavata TaxID=2740835 RepID=A0A8X6F321_TRICU|nr:hypothetical protein TNCT_710761 [Trichonephila clavata]
MIYTVAYIEVLRFSSNEFGAYFLVGGRRGLSAYRFQSRTNLKQRLIPIINNRSLCDSKQEPSLGPIHVLDVDEVMDRMWRYISKGMMYIALSFVLSRECLDHETASN